MASISVGEALGAGFRVIRRRPLAPLVWGIVGLVLVTLPYLLMMGSGITGLLSLGETSSPQEVQRAFGPMSAWGNLLSLWSIVVSAVLMSAVFRSVLEPEVDKTFYLRVGAREAWVGLVYFCQCLLTAIAVIPLVILMALSGGAAALAANAASGDGAAGAVAVAVVVCLGVAVFIWLLLRFSMATPMTFRDRTFRLFESWSFTKGYGLSLFLLCLGLVALGLLFYAVLGIIVVAVIASLLGAGADIAALQAAFESSPQEVAARVMPWIGGGILLTSLISGYLLAIFYAPWADAFRQIAAARGEAGAPAAASHGG